MDIDIGIHLGHLATSKLDQQRNHQPTIEQKFNWVVLTRNSNERNIVWDLLEVQKTEEEQHEQRWARKGWTEGQSKYCSFSSTALCCNCSLK